MGEMNCIHARTETTIYVPYLYLLPVRARTQTVYPRPSGGESPPPRNKHRPAKLCVRLPRELNGMGPLVRLIREVTGRDVIPFRAARQIFREGHGVTGERERWTGGHRLASYEEWKWMI
jgi:hypothetical protein